MRHTTNKANQHTLEFDNWHEFVNHAATAPSKMRTKERASKSASKQLERESHPVVRYWGGYASFDEAVDLSTHGWPEGAAEIAKTFADFNVPQKRAQTEMAFSPVGPGTIAMGRYIQGHPEPFMVQREVAVITDQATFNGGVAHLGINISQTGSVSARARFQMGALLLSLIDIMERNGKRVELTLFNAVTGRNGAYIRQAVTVKKADSSVNMSILAAAFGNAGTQRRLCWAVRETLDSQTRNDCNIKPRGNMGFTDEKWHTDGCTVVRGLGNVRFDNMAARNVWLKSQLAIQGIAWAGE